MKNSRYGLMVTTELSMAEAEARVRAALSDQGFGVLTEIDMAATLEEKLGVQRAPYKILGACNPPLAQAALEAEEAIGLLLPCNVAVYEVEGGRTVVAAMDPELMASLTENLVLSDVASQARDRIIAALATLE